MSRIGKQPISLPSGVSVTVDNDTISAKGPKGDLQLSGLPNVSVAVVRGYLTDNRYFDHSSFEIEYTAALRSHFGRLGNDEAGHGDFATIRKSPGSRCFRYRNCECAHYSFPSLIPAVRIFRMLLIP